MVLVKITKGPTGKAVILNIKIPTITAITPKNGAKNEYCFILWLKFRLAQTGIANKAAVNNPPTNLTAKDTIIAIQKRYKKLYFLTFIPSAFAKSS